MLKTIVDRFYSLNQFVVQSSSITVIILSLYLFQVEAPDTVIGSLYLISVFSYYCIVILLVTLVTFPLSLIPYIKYLAVIPKSLLDIFLVINFFVFKGYKFHIDSFFVNMMIHDTKGMGLSTISVAIAIGIVIVIFTINSWFFYQAKKTRIGGIGKIVLLSFAILIFNQFTFIWGSYFKQAHIINFTPYFPYYLPTTATRRMDKLKKSYPSIIPEQNTATKSQSFSIAKRNNNHLFNYPLNKIHFNVKKDAQPPNILFFVVESWRSDMMNEEVTPNISRFSKHNYEFINHYSGGSVTISGLFSLLYGIHPTNIKAAQSSPYKYQTVFLKSLKKLGYSIEVFTSSNINRFTMKEMFFGHIEKNNYHLELKHSVIKNDQKIVSQFISSLNDNKKPWFKFVFLTSSHHSYQYPKEHQKFTPIARNAEGFLFNKNTDPQPYLNDYKNSLSYVDSLFEQIRSQLKDDNTIIIVTSDHGEEFNDNGAGYWGHGSNFTKYQISVPLIVQMPNNKQHIKISKRSGHVDIVPTLLTMLGIENKTSDYSSGYDLFNLPENRNLIFSSYKNNAYLIDNTIYASGLFTDSYHINDFNKKNEDYDVKAISLMKESEVMFF